MNVIPTGIARYQTKLSGKRLVVKMSGTGETPPISSSFQASLADFTLESPALLREVFSVSDFDKISIVDTADVEIKLDVNSKELSVHLNANNPSFVMEFKGEALINSADAKDWGIRTAKLRFSKLSDRLKLEVLKIETRIEQPFPREGDDVVLEATGTFENIHVPGINRVLHPYNVKW